MIFKFLILLLIFYVCILHNHVRATEIIRGNMHSCTNEGEEVAVPIIDSKCFKCICRNGFVQCDEEQICPSTENCYTVLKNQPGSCCKRCKECLYKNVTYQSGDEWEDPGDPCLKLKCLSGVVTKTVIKCYQHCDASNFLPPKEGQCCGTCLGCRINGQNLAEGKEISSEDDPCLTCTCSKKKLTCVKKACPVLQCPISQQIKRRRSDCCPYKCRESKNLRELPNSCFLGDFRPNKSVFYPDKCTNCTCSNGTSVCERTTCPVLECSEQYRDYDKGCCPTCKTSEVRTECTKNGITRQDQESWKEGSCTSCVCRRGEFSCVRMRCEIPKCKHNEHLITPEGECCQQCVESKATCSIFGDPHFKTFDGKFFSFQGSCKYLLTSDCRNHSFSIRLTNDGKNTKTSSWAKTVTLKMGNFRVNLGQKLRVKVNGTRVILPYSDGPIKNIIKLPDGIKLTTHLGVSIEWDGNNFIQIEVPNHYKNMLCGLCGNYNGISRDDFTSRDGTIHTDENEVWRFANSWRVGGKKACSRKKEATALQPTCKLRKTAPLCQDLTDSNIFGKCENIVNPENYVKSCKMDMCECPGGMCFCDSITAYVHECEKMGVVLPNWRNLTKCSTNYWKRSHINKLINYPIMYNNHRVQSSKRKKNHFNSNVINRTHPLQSPEEYFKKHLPEGLLDRNTNRQRSGTPPPLI